MEPVTVTSFVNGYGVRFYECGCVYWPNGRSHKVCRMHRNKSRRSNGLIRF